MVVMFFQNLCTTGQKAYIGLGIGKTSKGHTSASFWGRDFFLLNKAGLSLSPYMRYTNQDYQASDVYESDGKTEHDEQVLGCILNFSEKKHPGFEDLSLVLGFGRYNQREQTYLYTADGDGYGIGSSYYMDEKKGASFEFGFSWRFKFKKTENLFINLNYTCNTYAFFIASVGTTFLIKH